MRWICLLFALTGGLFSSSQTLMPVRLKPNQPLKITGTLMMRPGGRLQFVTVKTGQAYVPVFAGYGAERAHDGAPVHEIALAGYKDYALLYAHRGQRVTVTGVLSTDDASPYYRDGMRMTAAHIQAEDGHELLGATAALARVAADVSTYRTEALLPADLAAPWRYTVNGTVAARAMLSCSSNGGGDVVNCFCAEGFHAVAATSSLPGEAAAGQLLDGAMAQFAVGDEARAVTLRVTCSR